ncbi:piggyBac transposable element-derived protein 4-like [Mytilus edulis]
MEDSDGDITDIVTSGDEDSDDADVEMPDNAARQPNPWFSVVDKETFELDVNRDFEERIGPCGFEANFSPVDYFDKFLKTEDDDLIDRIVDETNRYANQCQTTENPTRHARSNEWSPVSYAEMRAFIGLVLAMGIVKKTSIESYWEASGISETPNFRDVMSRNRFQAILRYLHCSDNTTAVPRGQPGYDPLHKINPVVEFFNEVFELNYR